MRQDTTHPAPRGATPSGRHATAMRCLIPLLSMGCTASGPADLGPAVLAIYLGNETEVGELLHLRSGAMLVFATDVTTDGFTPRDVIRRAKVESSTGAEFVAAAHLGDGVYLTGLSDAQALAPTGDAFVTFQKSGDTLGLSGPTPPVLSLPLEAILTPWDADLVIPLPARWWSTYPQVITQVLDLQGRVVWTDRPSELSGWIDRIAAPPRPRQITLPAETLPPGSYVVASAFVDQMDLEVVYEGPINEPFSGLWAGTARLVPLEVTK